MRNIISSAILIFSGFLYADELSFLYEADALREEMESKLSSFGLTVVYYLESVHGGIVIVPCREAERWRRVLNEVRGIIVAEHNRNILEPDNSLSSIPTCVPETESTYDEASETLIVPQLYLDGKIYRAELEAPFNIRELDHIGELEIYQYDQ